MSDAKQEIQTLDQLRAKHAWTRIKKLMEAFKDSKDQEEYAGEAKKLPMRIMASGLGQALAFILAKANKGEKPKEHLIQLHNDLSDWVIKNRGFKAAVPNSLLESVIQGDTDFLRLATDETLAYLQWLNRFAEAKGLGKEANQ